MMLPSNGNLYESYFEICPNTYLPVTRGNTTQDFEYEAFKAYENNDFATSENAFRQLLATENNHNIRFYYAMSLLNQQKFDAALQELQTLSNENFDYQVESLWYAALIQIKKDKKEDAKQYLSKIQQLNSSYKTDEINSILARL